MPASGGTFLQGSGDKYERIALGLSALCQLNKSSYIYLNLVSLRSKHTGRNRDIQALTSLAGQLVCGSRKDLVPLLLLEESKIC